jgi:hypothetical protein
MLRKSQARPHLGTDLTTSVDKGQSRSPRSAVEPTRLTQSDLTRGAVSGPDNEQQGFCDFWERLVLRNYRAAELVVDTNASCVERCVTAHLDRGLAAGEVDRPL